MRANISHPLDIAAEFSGRSIKELEQEFTGSTCAQFKESVAEYIISGLTPFQERYNALQNDSDAVISILKHGKEKAEAVANATLHDVKEKMGFLI